MTGTEELRRRLTNICASLPEVSIEGDQHLIYRVGRRTFAYFLEDHHGDAEIAMVCKVESGLNAVMVDSDPDRCFMPAYIGPRGWIAVRLDHPDVDWEEIGDLVTMSYRMIAPKRCIRQLNGSR